MEEHDAVVIALSVSGETEQVVHKWQVILKRTNVKS